MPAAVLFDMDGVLIDSFGIWLAVMNATAQELGHPAISRAQLVDAFGQGLEEDVRRFYPGATVDDVRTSFARAMPGHLHEVRVDPEAGEVLRELGRQGVRRAVVTNTQDDLAGAVLQAAGLADAVDFVSALSPGVREKPAPDLVLRALEALGVEAPAAGMVGDTDFDARAAAAAGVPFLRHRMGHDGSLREGLTARGWIARPPVR